MKKFTKILIALGAAGIAKYIYNHVDIVTNKELEERIKKEAEVIAKERTYELKESKIYKDIGKNIHDGLFEGLNSTQSDNDKKGTGRYTISFCDHVYYDNPYNISKIYLDKNGCPQVFEFENEKDRNDALEAYYNYLKGCDDEISMISVYTTFDIVGLISDDYSDFENYFVFWDPEDFIKANAENAIPNTINFGEFENFRNYKKECSK